MGGSTTLPLPSPQRIEPRTFLPLDSIRVYPISEKLRGLGGSCKLLFDCVKYEQPEIRVRRCLQQHRHTNSELYKTSVS